MKKRGIFVLVVALFFLVSFSYFSLANNSEQLKVTLEHPFLVNGNWVSASSLAVGDYLTTSSGKKARITGIEEVIEDTEVYNLETSENNYVAGGIVVHNSNSASEVAKTLSEIEGKLEGIVFPLSSEDQKVVNYVELFLGRELNIREKKLVLAIHKSGGTAPFSTEVAYAKAVAAGRFDSSTGKEGGMIVDGVKTSLKSGEGNYLVEIGVLGEGTALHSDTPLPEVPFKRSVITPLNHDEIRRLEQAVVTMKTGQKGSPEFSSASNEAANLVHIVSLENAKVRLATRINTIPRYMRALNSGKSFDEVAEALAHEYDTMVWGATALVRQGDGYGRPLIERYDLSKSGQMGFYGYLSTSMRGIQSRVAIKYLYGRIPVSEGFNREMCSADMPIGQDKNNADLYLKDLIRSKEASPEETTASDWLTSYITNKIKNDPEIRAITKERWIAIIENPELKGDELANMFGKEGKPASRQVVSLIKTGLQRYLRADPNLQDSIERFELRKTAMGSGSAE